MMNGNQDRIKTGVQQIMLGSVTRNGKQAKETLQRIRMAGYDGIELNSFMIHKTPFIVRLLTKAAGMPVGSGGKLDWKRLIQESGLSVISLHTDLGSLKKDPGAVAAEAKTYGTKNVVITGMYRFDYSDKAAVDELCRDLNQCGQELASDGIRLLYHNHNSEWRKLHSLAGDGDKEETAYDYILAHTDPAFVSFEFDSYWPTEAGVNVPEVMKRLGNRMKLWHVTDRGTRISGPSMTPILKSDTVELGTGNIDLEGLAEIARANGVEAVVLETHRNWIGNDPLQSVEDSGQWLKEHL